MVTGLVGELPDGWTEIPLADVCVLRAGPSTPPDSGGSVAIVKPRNLADGRITGAVDRMTEQAAARLSAYRLAPGDVICVRTGALGRNALVTDEHEGSVFGSGVIRLRPDDRVDPRYLNHYLSHPAVRGWLARNSSGTAVPSISTRSMGVLPVALAPLDTQRRIGDALGALDDKIAVHERIRQATLELRDTLLPLLMSGVGEPGAVEQAGGVQFEDLMPSRARSADGARPA
ncbi:restriction endonuclease subunit S [Sphaerisporangium dianthi]|uniref:Restriction endonuclease subunit S n=1 Tax=Sphaerisporangium dianthi TaxID=1436120 RepID=A0ABV9C988_9ACTN